MCDSDRIQAGGLVMKADNNSAGIDRNSQELTGRITPGIRKADVQEQPDGDVYKRQLTVHEFADALCGSKLGSAQSSSGEWM